MNNFFNLKDKIETILLGTSYYLYDMSLKDNKIYIYPRFSNECLPHIEYNTTDGFHLHFIECVSVGEGILELLKKYSESYGVVTSLNILLKMGVNK